MDQMKQNKLVKKMYQASLENNKAALKDLYQKEIQHILEKKKHSKTSFCPKWLVTDNK